MLCLGWRCINNGALLAIAREVSLGGSPCAKEYLTLASLENRVFHDRRSNLVEVSHVKPRVELDWYKFLLLLLWLENDLLLLFFDWESDVVEMLSEFVVKLLQVPSALFTLQDKGRWAQYFLLNQLFNLYCVIPLQF